MSYGDFPEVFDSLLSFVRYFFPPEGHLKSKSSFFVATHTRDDNPKSNPMYSVSEENVKAG